MKVATLPSRPIAIPVVTVVTLFPMAMLASASIMVMLMVGGILVALKLFNAPNFFIPHPSHRDAGII